MNNNIQTLWQNKHLRYAVIVLAAIEIISVWLPHYKEQLSATQKIVMMYAVAASANSAPSQTNLQP